MNYREGVEIPSAVSKSNRTLNLLHARAELLKTETPSEEGGKFYFLRCHHDLAFSYAASKTRHITQPKTMMIRLVKIISIIISLVK